MTAGKIAFLAGDDDSAPNILAYEAADLQGLGCEFASSGLDVHLCDAERVGDEIHIPVIGVTDISTIQHYFNQHVYWVKDTPGNNGNHPQRQRGYEGRKARIISSTGFHSRQYIGREGVAVMRVASNSDKTRWVVRFPTCLFINEHGLYDEAELAWL